MLFAFILLRAGPLYRLFFFRVCAASRISSPATFVKFDHFRDARKMIVRVTNQIDAAFAESVRYSWNWSLLFTLMQKGINIVFPIEKNRDHSSRRITMMGRMTLWYSYALNLPRSRSADFQMSLARLSSLGLSIEDTM